MKVMVSGHVELPVLQGIEWVKVYPDQALPPQVSEARGLVLWTLNRDFVRHLLEHAKQLQWIQTLTAGVDHVLAMNLPEHITLYRAPNLHEELVTEHTLALLLSIVRKLHVLRDQQREGRWFVPHPFGSLHSKHVVIWGYGNIGRSLARVLKVLGSRVTGVRTQSGHEDGVPIITRQDFPQVLPQADHLVMVLPSTPATHQVLDQDVLDLLPERAWVINVGRGDAMNQEDLLQALKQGRIAGAALDVTSPEPLPADHPFWRLENVILTPHVASQSDRLQSKMREFMLENLSRLHAGEQMVGKVERHKGY
ncbi:D-2-hydroxyacid dehydrogenase [Deinococcus roseus]|uniref:Phosphoglycerate dehydrogenase n=1 Tax=Deinococcus roseus TaxID=392414 RepID=A0ABQ2CZQ7_9DEIO|nr:D-2-hydroxyacid dehydrogenase [Deinococcus roseus]GGJ30439.1 phosphoglycerate dehydrogenase [Deinococcus roseus]